MGRFWVVFDWVLNIYGWTVALIFIADRVWSQDIRGLLIDFDGREKAESGLLEILTVTSSVAWYSMWLQVLVVYYQLLVLVRFFKASRGQARLATVVTTIQRGIVDIAHLLIVFGVIMSAYVCSGHILFGSRLPEFATFNASLSECIAMIFKREYEWARFSEEDQFTAMMWCWSFVVVNALILVNVFLAMIFDNYAEIRSANKNSDTLWQTAYKLFEQVLYFGTWVPNTDLLSALQDMRADKSVTRSQIRRSLPRIPDAQLGRLFAAAGKRWEGTLLRGNKNLEVEALASVLLSIWQIMNETRVARGDAAEAPEDESDASDVDLGLPAQPPRWLSCRLAPHLERRAAKLETIPWHLDAVERQLQHHGVASTATDRPLSRPALESEDAWARTRSPGRRSSRGAARGLALRCQRRRRTWRAA